MASTVGAMSEINDNQPLGTPTWLDLGVPDVDKAKDYYATVFGWDFEDSALGTRCLLRGLPVAGLHEGDHEWRVHLATDDCDASAVLVEKNGGTVVEAPHEVGDLGRAALVTDSVGVTFGLWQGRAFPGYRLANEPDTVVRNDLVTPQAQRARDFYTEVFGFTLDGNPTLPDLDFTFLRRPDGYEIGGIMGAAATAKSLWATTFEVADADATVARAGSTAIPEDTPYGRSATLVDPFGVEFAVIARPQ